MASCLLPDFNKLPWGLSLRSWEEFVQFGTQCSSSCLGIPEGVGIWKALQVVLMGYHPGEPLSQMEGKTHAEPYSWWWWCYGRRQTGHTGEGHGILLRASTKALQRRWHLGWTSRCDQPNKIHPRKNLILNKFAIKKEKKSFRQKWDLSI